MFHRKIETYHAIYLFFRYRHRQFYLLLGVLVLILVLIPAAPPGPAHSRDALFIVGWGLTGPLKVFREQALNDLPYRMCSDVYRPFELGDRVI